MHIRWLAAASVLTWANLAATIGATIPRGLPAQMPGQPVLQNAWANPGFTLAANVGSGSHVHGYAGAVAWAPGNARFQLSAGLGVLDPEGGRTATSTGARVMVPLPFIDPRGNFGVSGFAGVGAARPASGSVLVVPVGIAAGYRHAIGATHGISAYVAPYFGWTRVKVDTATSRSAGLVRVSAGLDVALTPAIGVSAGFETGSTASAGNPGPTGGVFGFGVSYLLHQPS
jgi:hypothetical protein